ATPGGRQPKAARLAAPAGSGRGVSPRRERPVGIDRLPTVLLRQQATPQVSRVPSECDASKHGPFPRQPGAVRTSRMRPSKLGPFIERYWSPGCIGLRTRTEVAGAALRDDSRHPRLLSYLP